MGFGVRLHCGAGQLSSEVPRNARRGLSWGGTNEIATSWQACACFCLVHTGSFLPNGRMGPGLRSLRGGAARRAWRNRRDRHQARNLPTRHAARGVGRSEEHTSELQSLMRISYAVFCLKKKKKTVPIQTHNTNYKDTTNT